MKSKPRKKKAVLQVPVVCVGWYTIAQLAQGKTVRLSNAYLIPDDLLFNTARRIETEKE